MINIDSKTEEETIQIITKDLESDTKPTIEMIEDFRNWLLSLNSKERLLGAWTGVHKYRQSQLLATFMPEETKESIDAEFRSEVAELYANEVQFAITCFNLI